MPVKMLSNVRMRCTEHQKADMYAKLVLCSLFNMLSLQDLWATSIQAIVLAFVTDSAMQGRGLIGILILRIISLSCFMIVTIS